MSRKIVNVGGEQTMSLNQFVNSYSPKFLRKLNGNEKSQIMNLKNNQSYFLGVDSYLCKVTRVK